MPPTAEQIQYELQTLLNAAERMGFLAVEVQAGALHRQLGGYPGPEHRMDLCCEVMRAEMAAADAVRAEPENGTGPHLVIRYVLPRSHSHIDRN